MFTLIGLLLVALGTDALRVPRLTWQEVDFASNSVVRLVKKAWKPRGVGFDDAVDEFPGRVSEAFDILWNERNRIDYLEQPLEKAHLLFTMKNQEGTVEFDPQLESIVIVHPLFTTDDVGFINNTVTALGMRNVHRKFNVFTIDSQGPSLSTMLSMVQEAIGVPADYEHHAQTLSSVLVRAIVTGQWTPEKIHLVGHSHSASLVGYMARYISFLFDQKIASLMCLNPTNSLDRDVLHVTRDDARTVHILHSSGYSAGARRGSGTAEFVVNSGYVQPECDTGRVWLGTAEAFSCSQLEGVKMFWYVILYPSRFLARRCDSWVRLQTCLCDDNQEASIAYPIGANPADGIYYLRTTLGRPYGMAEEGSRCELSAKAALEKKKREEYDRVLESLED